MPRAEKDSLPARILCIGRCPGLAPAYRASTSVESQRSKVHTKCVASFYALITGFLPLKKKHTARGVPGMICTDTAPLFHRLKLEDILWGTTRAWITHRMFCQGFRGGVLIVRPAASPCRYANGRAGDGCVAEPPIHTKGGKGLSLLREVSDSGSVVHSQWMTHQVLL